MSETVEVIRIIDFLLLVPVLRIRSMDRSGMSLNRSSSPRLTVKSNTVKCNRGQPSEPSQHGSVLEESFLCARQCLEPLEETG